jgi:hypothetical protein
MLGAYRSFADLQSLGSTCALAVTPSLTDVAVQSPVRRVWKEWSPMIMASVHFSSVLSGIQCHTTYDIYVSLLPQWVSSIQLNSRGLAHTQQMVYIMGKLELNPSTGFHAEDGLNT